MSLTQVTHPIEEAASNPAWRHTAQRWLREPLLHFLLIGASLFAIDHVMVSRADDPHTIVVGAEVDAEARQVFKSSRGREPHAEELAALRQVWLDNEVLYREGLAMQLDKGDPSIRERVIFKALSVVDADTKLPPLDDATLHRWFESHRAKYDEPPRYDFQEAVMPGESTEAAVRAFVESLNNGSGGEANAGLRVFKGRPQSNLVQSYGQNFADALQKAPLARWQALPSSEGWRAVRVDAIASPKPAEFESLRNVVRQDWTDAVLAEQRTAAVRALAKKYTIKIKTEAASQ